MVPKRSGLMPVLTNAAPEHQRHDRSQLRIMRQPFLIKQGNRTGQLCGIKRWHLGRQVDGSQSNFLQLI
jgi:hypothetical protein